MRPLRDPSSVPSMKGIGFAPVIERLRARIDTGKLSDLELDLKLQEADRALLESPIGPTLWYPVVSFERLLLLLRDQEGGIGNDYFVTLGVDTAEASLSTGAVQVLLKGARAFGPRAGIALIKLSKLYFNFSEWDFEGDDLEHFTVVVSDAAPLPEPCRYTTLGFMQHLVLQFTGKRVRLTSQRPSADRIVYKTL